MNRVETLLVDSPPRAWLQRWYEVPLFARLGGRLDGATVVEIGCGRGVGTQLLLDRLGAAEVTALDLDPAMVARARARLARYGPRARVLQGDATALPLADASVDAVVDFAVVHHVPAWRDAVAEAARVLRPGGRLLFDEVTSHALRRWSYRTLFDHPRQDRFTPEQFTQELARHGLVLHHPAMTRFFGDFFIGVATKPLEPAAPVTSAGQAAQGGDPGQAASAGPDRPAGARGVPVLAVGLFTAWVLLAGVGRSLLQRAGTGDSGFRSTAATPGSAQWWASRVVAAGSLLLGLGAPLAELTRLPGARPLPVLANPRSRRAGAVLAVAGTAATCAAQLAMGASWRIGVDPGERTALVTTGPFALVRNPIFTAAAAAFTGLTLMVPNRFAAAGLALFTAGIQAQVRVVEEPHLRRTHRGAYSAYAARTGRFLPGIGREVPRSR